ncbi:MAG: hypothetical protein ABW139_07540 [Candidatus Thiodiazotropha sp. DIVDIV]
MTQKTTIWRESDSGKLLIETIQGLPYGEPRMGQILSIPKYGEVSCSGINKSGSGSSEEITEIQLTAK